VAVRAVGGAGEVGTAGTELEEALVGTEVGRSGLSTMGRSAVEEEEQQLAAVLGLVLSGLVRGRRPSGSCSCGRRHVGMATSVAGGGSAEQGRPVLEVPMRNGEWRWRRYFLGAGDR
jgi:hypothetical protein